MKKVLTSIYYFLPVQLLLLHFRKYQLLLIFWLILLLTITGNFASHFGAMTLFLAPEYMGKISFMSMFLVGAAMSVFIMMWHITTFIIHSRRMPYMGATRHAFVVYCYNNCLIPIPFLIFYSVVTVRFQLNDENGSVGNVILHQLGFYLGQLFVVLLSFAYFFRVSGDFFKALLSKIANPEIIRNIVPYDSLDYEIDIIPANSYISGRLKIEQSADLEPYHPRVMNTVLRRHHRNVIFATFIAYVLLLILGVFMERPLLRVPAGAGFLLLFAIVMGIVGAFKYFLKSWEAIGWILFVALLSLMVQYKIFDLRSIAYGLDYHKPTHEQPVYDYEHLHRMFTPKRFADDKKIEEARLQLWKNKIASDSALPPLVVITASGGGSRSAYWTFRCLQYLDSVSHGQLFRNTVLITGASGGMIAEAYWRCIHDAFGQGILKGDPYDRKYQANIGKDLLNAIIFSLASVDLVSPFNKIDIAGYSYTRDRGYAMEQEMITNTDGMLNKNMGYFREREALGEIPLLVINGTIINDGRKLMICDQPLGYLTQPEYSLHEPIPPIDAVDFMSFFATQNPYNIRLTSALRMNATFPFVLPVVRMPSEPRMNIMDAGLRDNFGAEVAKRYLYVMRDWLEKNTRDIIYLELRDTRENDQGNGSDQTSLGRMVIDPVFVIQNRWESFQSYSHTYYKDYAPYYLGGKLRFITLQYVPREAKQAAALNFHLTQKEKDDIYQSIDNPDNRAAIDTLVRMLH